MANKIPMVIFTVSLIALSGLVMYWVMQIDIGNCLDVQCKVVDISRILGDLVLYQFLDQTITLFIAGFLAFLPIVLLVSFSLWIVATKLSTPKGKVPEVKGDDWDSLKKKWVAPGARPPPPKQRMPPKVEKSPQYRVVKPELSTTEEILKEVEEEVDKETQ